MPDAGQRFLLTMIRTRLDEAATLCGTVEGAGAGDLVMAVADAREIVHGMLELDHPEPSHEPVNSTDCTTLPHHPYLPPAA